MCKMEGWKEGTIKSVATIGSGRDYKHLKEGNVPVFGTGGYMTSVNDFLYDGETVCIGRKGTIDTPLYYSGKIWTVDTLFYTHSFDNILPKLLFYIFQTIDWKKYNEATGVPSLSKKTIEQIKIIFPESEVEQSKITTILNTIELSISQTEQLIAKYKNIKQGLMHDLLTFGIDQNGSIRDPHTHSFVEKNGMVVPKEWEVKRIDEISEVNPNKGKEIPSIVSFIAMGDVSENAKLISPKLIAFKTVKNGFTPFKRGDILVAKITPCFENGKGAFLNELYSEYGFGSTEFHVLRSKINAYFLYIHTTSIPFRNKLSAQMTGSAGQRRVSTDAIRNYKIGIPSKFEQQKIISILEQQGKLIESEQANLAKLQKLKQGLMQDLLTGKVRVKI